MVVAECPKIFEVRCIWGWIFVYLDKNFVFKYFWTIFHLVFMWNIHGKGVTRTFGGIFFWVPVPLKRYQNTSGCTTDYIYNWELLTRKTFQYFKIFFFKKKSRWLLSSHLNHSAVLKMWIYILIRNSAV